jgi:hypothetical protein
VEILALMGMKTQRRRSVLANCEGQRSGLEWGRSEWRPVTGGGAVCRFVFRTCGKEGDVRRNCQLLEQE